MRDFQTKANVGAVADSISATRFGAGEFNALAVELENAVESSDQTLAPADGTGEVDTQLAMAMAIYGAGGAAYMLDTGVADAYVLNPVSPKEAPPDYFDGFTITFIPGNANTGASTVNVNAIGAKSITLIDGTALSGGEINGNVTIRYNLSDDAFHLIQAGARQTLQIFTISGSYSKPDGLKHIEVWVIGGGGGGGGVAASANYLAGGGGSGGGASFKSIYASSLSASETVTVGAGGAGGANTGGNGSTGGTSSFGAHCQATGGGGGYGDTTGSASAPVVLPPGVNITLAGGIGSGGDINLSAGSGSYAEMLTLGTILGARGGAAAGPFGGNPAFYTLRSATAAGVGANNYGCGGGGAIGAGATGEIGGDGADGIVVIKEFF